MLAKVRVGGVPMSMWLPLYNSCDNDYMWQFFSSWIEVGLVLRRPLWARVLALALERHVDPACCLQSNPLEGKALLAAARSAAVITAAVANTQWPDDDKFKIIGCDLRRDGFW